MKKSCLSSLLVLMLFASTSIFAQNYTWNKEPNLPVPIYSPASFTIGNDIFVVSGVAVSYSVSGFPLTMSYGVWDYNTVSNTWTQKGNFPGTAVYGASGFAIGSYGYVVNGWDSTGSGEGPSNTWQYDPSNDTWTAKAAFPGATRYDAAAFAINGKGYVTCGFSPFMNDTWCYDPVANSWSSKSNFPGTPRQCLASFTVGNIQYLGMGDTGDGNGGYYVPSDMYKYDPSTDTWTQLNDFPSNPVSVSYSFTLNGTAYVMMGLNEGDFSYTTGASNVVYQYDNIADSWSVWGVFPDTAIYGGVSTQCNGQGYLGLGATNWHTVPITNMFYRFGPGTGPFSCNVTIGQYQISNAVYNFQANGDFSPTAQITWNFGDGSSGSGTSVIHHYTTIGTYAVTVNVSDSASNCTNSITDSVTISNINNCSVNVSNTSFDSIFTLSAQVSNGVGPYTYQWSTSSDSNYSSTSPDPVVSVPYYSSETYCVTVTDTTGCVASACETLVDSPAYVSPCTVYIVVYPDSTIPGWYYGTIYVGGNNNLTYLWNFGDGTTSTQPFPSHTYATPGYYTICLTVSDSAASCSFTICDSSFYAFKYGGGPMSQFNVVGEQVLGISNITSSNTISVYPNPANSEITINAAGQKVDNATIYDINGQTVVNAKSPSQNKMDVSQLSDGIYFIEIKVNDVTTRVKFVKTN